MVSPRLVASLRSRAAACLHQRITTSRHASTRAAVREDPDYFSRNCQERKYVKQASYPGQIVELLNRRFALEKDALEPKKRRNIIKRRLETSKETAESITLLRAEAKEIKMFLSEEEQKVKALDEEIDSLLVELPNLTHYETPRGDEPRTVELVNAHVENDFTPKDASLRDHVAIGTQFELLDFTSAVKVSGHGHCNLLNEAVFLEQALLQYAIDVATKHGFKPVKPSSRVYSDLVAACGFRPRDQNAEQQIYQLQQSEEDAASGLRSSSLSATAEIPFAAMMAETILSPESLPMRIVGPSRCFRREAGAHGRQHKGLYRLHEFEKLEMFAWTTPEGDQEVFNSMISIQKEILESLRLFFRILEMPSTDLGASAYRKQDIEVYFPSRADLNGGWGEVTSTSLCTDYQTWRLRTRFKSADRMIYPHTVNGTAMAVPRVLAALLEYGYVKDEEVIQIPQVLWPYMHGKTKITMKGP